MGPDPVFSIPTRVYWEDTDAGGVVYHAQYIAFLERARTEWLRGLGYGQELLREAHGLVFAIRSVQVGFHRPARLDDALQVSAALGQCRRASALFLQDIRRGDELLVSARVGVVALGAADFRPRAIPDEIYARLKLHESRTTDAG
jgi:acyl-CoA thioester hydrolase